VDGGCFRVSRLSAGTLLGVMVIDCNGITGELCVVDVLEAILSLTLAEKHFTEMTGP
jgi:hypothetical protein